MKTTRRGFLRNSSGMLAAFRTASMWAAGANPVCEIQPRIGQQMIDGFGISEAFFQAYNIQQLGEKERNAVLDLLFNFNGGMGFSILRNIIGDRSGKGYPTKNIENIEPKPGEWYWESDKDQIWLVGEAKKRGCNRIMASCWSPPAWMKDNNQTWGGGSLRSDKYQAYAEYLAEYVVQYKAKFGIDIYALSPANEPDFVADWPSCIWTGSSMTKFLRENLIPTFAAKGVTAEIVIDEHGHWTDEFINTILADPTCNKAINIVAAHAYTKTDQPFMPLNQRVGKFTQALDKGKRVWMTEVSAGDKQMTSMLDGTYWARVCHASLVESRVSAFFYWWGAAVGESRSSLIALDTKNKTYQLTKRLFTLGQYARFIRPGSQRVTCTQFPVPNVVVSAFLDPTRKKIIAVAVNDDAKDHDIDFKLTEFPVTACIPVRTSSTENHARLAPPKVENNAFTASLPANTVTTFILGQQS